MKGVLKARRDGNFNFDETDDTEERGGGWGVTKMAKIKLKM
jgi:hypothetical protein